MIAASMTAYREALEVRNVREPQALPGSAVVKVAACGICRSDWHFWAGDWAWRMEPQFPRIPGHEISGVVESCGHGVRRFRPGDRVIVPFHNGCGECRWCQAGMANLCEHYASLGFSFDGGFAEYTAIPGADHNLVPLPESIEMEAAAALGCRFMTAWHGLMDRLHLQPGETLAVFGCGGLGLSVIQIALNAGARVIAVDKNSAQLGMAANLGVEELVDVRSADPVDAIQELCAGGSDCSVDALGIQETCAPALECLRRQGRHLQLGLTGAKERGHLALPIDRIAKLELELVGSLGCPRESYQRLLAVVSSGRLKPEALVAERCDLHGAGAVLQRMSHFETRGLCLIKP